jgi:hypothetical protein
VRELWPFLKALWSIWWTLMSTAIFTFLGILAAAMNWGNAWIYRTSFVLAIMLLFVGAFLAWRKEYRANISGPLVLLRWRSPGDVLNRDAVDVLNQGTAVALQIVLEEFSRPEFSWTHPIEIPHIDPGDKRAVQAYFSRWVAPQASEIGHLRGVLHSLPGDEELTLTVRYTNLQGTRFRRTFLLRLVDVGRTREIECRPGKLETER